ncbi:hypothetical protein ATHL_03598 [Anaerolinea thermolimosa]|uniref:DUF4007 domain-containing protein n=1 Tax=Anaerolinea thermolimosa TaxID=229919 RepID=A0A7U9KMW0_9CHLR|nr:DUF4007 family protein [Anaerolinea thermolimosa]GAP08691.1 hypothetical protein ATHL_03598 [Anaerolinea thermolimosa]
MNSFTAQRTRVIFGGHEKFTFRYGWLKKGLDAVLENPDIFSQEDAFVTLGVGKNMATSIRYWMLALGICESPSERTRTLLPTSLGKSLFTDDGWDPYLEDIGSLWLLHWQLASNQQRGLIWHLVFSRYFDIEFRKNSLTEFLKNQLVQRGIETTEGMIEREVDVFIRTYVAAQSRNRDGEENLDCPLVDLNLIHFTPGDGVYRFDIGAKSSLPSPIMGYAISIFLEEKLSHQRTVTLDDCVYSPGSPGQIFKLDENSMISYLEDLEDLTGGALRLQETAGLRQVYVHAAFKNLGWDLLRKYYA